jgi:hypothetical protein
MRKPLMVVCKISLRVVDLGCDQELAVISTGRLHEHDIITTPTSILLNPRFLSSYFIRLRKSWVSQVVVGAYNPGKRFFENYRLFSQRPVPHPILGTLRPHDGKSIKI